MIALVKDMKRPWLFATPAFLFQIFAVSTRDQTTAPNNAARLVVPKRRQRQTG
jgi:hypothetical protein